MPKRQGCDFRNDVADGPSGKGRRPLLDKTLLDTSSRGPMAAVQPCAVSDEKIISLMGGASAFAVDECPSERHVLREHGG